MRQPKPDLVNQPSARPSRKVLMGAIAGILAAGLNALLAWLLESYPPFAWLDDPQVRGAVPILAATAAGYIFRERTLAPDPNAQDGDGDNFAGGDLYPFPKRPVS